MKSQICELLNIEFPMVAFSHCRDVELLKQMDLGILALGSTTTKTNKNNKGLLGEDVIFGGVILSEDSWLYVDKNGWLVSKEPLEFN